jgi:hypothetical protein
MIIDITKKIADKVKRKEDEKLDMFSSITNDMLRCAANGIHFGATDWQVIGAASFVIARAMAKADPYLEKLYRREMIYSIIDSLIDEEVLQHWAEELTDSESKK